MLLPVGWLEESTGMMFSRNGQYYYRHPSNCFQHSLVCIQHSLFGWLKSSDVQETKLAHFI